MAARFPDHEPRGEFVVAVHVDAEDAELSGDALDREVVALAAAGMPAREIAAALKPRGAHRRDVYASLRRGGFDLVKSPRSSPTVKSRKATKATAGEEPLRFRIQGSSGFFQRRPAKRPNTRSLE